MQALDPGILQSLGPRGPRLEPRATDSELVGRHCRTNPNLGARAQQTAAIADAGTLPQNSSDAPGIRIRVRG